MGKIPEADAYQLSGLENVYAGEGYKEGFIKILDRLRFMTNCEIFRAYAYQRIMEIVDLRPNDWGVAWIPAISEHRSDLAKLVEGNLKSPDWLVPAKQTKYVSALSQFFMQSTNVSDYGRQAQFFHELAVQAVDHGLQLCGYVRADGKESRVRPLGEGKPLFGLDQDGVPTLLFRWSSTNARHEVVSKVMPFTPLYAFQEPLESILKQAKERSFTNEADEPWIQRWLQPLFKQR